MRALITTSPRAGPFGQSLPARRRAFQHPGATTRGGTLARACPRRAIVGHGLRIGEATSIIWDDIDLANDRISVRDSAGRHPADDMLRVSAHMLRHIFAWILFVRGEDPPYVMAQFGHSDPGFTLRVLRPRDVPRRGRQRATEGARRGP
jgi:integrase